MAKTRSLCSAGIISAVLACAAPGRPPPSTPSAATRLAEIRAEAESLRASLAERAWRNDALGQPAAVAELFAGKEWLTELETARLVESALASASSERERRALEHLGSFLLEATLTRAAAPAMDRATRLRLQSPTPPDRIWGQLAREADAATRRRLADEALPVLEQISAALWGALRERDRAARARALDSPERLSKALVGFDALEVGRLARAVLRQTDALYASLLSEIAAESAGNLPTSLATEDLDWLRSGAQFDAFFPPEDLVTVVGTALQNAGLASAAPPSINTRSATGGPGATQSFAVAGATEVRIAVVPRGGAADYAALLDAMGRAGWHQWTHNPPPALHHRSDPSVGSAIGQLLRGLVREPAWLSEHTELDSPHLERFVRIAHLDALCELRAVAAEVAFETELRTRPLPQSARRPQQEHAGWLERALRVDVRSPARARWPLIWEPGFGAAVRLRGALLAGQLRRHLRDQFGPRWWKDAMAGRWLTEVVRSHPAMTGEELARALGTPTITPDANLELLADALATPTHIAAH